MIVPPTAVWQTSRIVLLRRQSAHGAWTLVARLSVLDADAVVVSVRPPNPHAAALPLLSRSALAGVRSGGTHRRLVAPLGPSASVTVTLRLGRNSLVPGRRYTLVAVAVRAGTAPVAARIVFTVGTHGLVADVPASHRLTPW